MKSNILTKKIKFGKILKISILNYIKTTLFFDLTIQVYASNILNLKLILSGNLGKIINDKYKTNNLTATINGVFYDLSNFTDFIASEGQNVAPERPEDLTDCCEDLFNVTGDKIIKEIDMNNFGLSNSYISSTKNMFYGQTYLTKINLENFKTNDVKDISNMFRDCESLEEINLSTLDFSNVENMEKMFYNAKKLTSLNIPNFSVGKLNLNEMFANCEKLETIDLSNITVNQIIYFKNIHNF